MDDFQDSITVGGILLLPSYAANHLIKNIGKRSTPGPRTYQVDVSESLHATLSTLAQDEGRPEHELIPELLNAGLHQYTANE